MTKKLSAVIGLNWGDEGKGKLVDILAGHYQFVARFGGGANAGHTIWNSGKKFVLHQMPSGALHPQTKNVIGNGCVVYLPGLIEEITVLEQAGVSVAGRLFISSRATLLFDFHKLLDAAQEAARGAGAVGTTKSGIGPAYADKAGRNSFRIADLADWSTFAVRLRERLTELNKTHKFGIDIEAELTRYEDYAERIEGLVTDTSALLREALESGKTVLAEGAQGTLLDVDHGTFPFVTSSVTSAGGVFSGLGIAPQGFSELIGVVKAYTTRVGSGPFPTEQLNPVGEKLREIGHEYGATTGRPRRCGWIDLVATRYAAQLCGATALNLTKLDVLNDFAEIQLCTGYELDGKRLDTVPATAAELARIQPIYETLPGWQTDTSACRHIADLPANARKFVERIAEFVGAPVKFVGVGVDRADMAV